MMYLVPNPGHDEDNQDKEDLDNPDDARQGAEEIAASPDIPGQEPEKDPVIFWGEADHEQIYLEEEVPPDVVWDTLT